jgi:hypothetical protein
VTVPGDGYAHVFLSQDAGGAWRGGFAETDNTYKGENPARYQLKVGDVVEASVMMPGACPAGATSCAEDIWDFPGSVWANSHQGLWPMQGETDPYEGLGGAATINYHGCIPPSGSTTCSDQASNGFPLVACCYGNEFHTITWRRNPATVEVWWDGVLQRTISTHDTGQDEVVTMNIGVSGSRAKHPGPEGQVLVNYVRAWSPA